MWLGIDFSVLTTPRRRRAMSYGGHSGSGLRLGLESSYILYNIYYIIYVIYYIVYIIYYIFYVI